jgi:hypothetical protein
VLAVVQLADHDGAVDVAVHKVHQHFGARAGREDRAPVRSSHALRHAHPGAAALVPWGMTRGRAGGAGGRAQATRQGGGTALPAKLDADATVAVGGERLARKM